MAYIEGARAQLTPESLARMQLCRSTSHACGGVLVNWDELELLDPGPGAVRALFLSTTLRGQRASGFPDRELVPSTIIRVHNICHAIAVSQVYWLFRSPG